MIENNYLQQADVALQKGIEVKRKKCYNVHSKKCFLQCMITAEYKKKKTANEIERRNEI